MWRSDRSKIDSKAATRIDQRPEEALPEVQLSIRNLIYFVNFFIGDLDVDIKMAGKAREKFKNIDAQNPGSVPIPKNKVRFFSNETSK